MACTSRGLLYQTAESVGKGGNAGLARCCFDSTPDGRLNNPLASTADDYQPHDGTHSDIGERLVKTLTLQATVEKGVSEKTATVNDARTFFYLFFSLLEHLDESVEL